MAYELEFEKAVLTECQIGRTRASELVVGFRERLDERTDTRLAMCELMAKYLEPNMDLYDVGCGTKPFKDFLRSRVRRHIGIDIDSGFYAHEQIDLIGSADNLPLEPASADAVLSSQVIEHLRDPVAGVREAYRVLRPGGFLFLSCPFLYPIHAMPHDYSRLTRYGLDEILRQTGFELLEFRQFGGYWYVMAVFSTLYFNTMPVLRRMKLNRILSWFARTVFDLLHRMETRAIESMGKDPGSTRAAWAVGYALVARRPMMEV